MAKKPHDAPKTDGWKDTYGDMVTLLLCFFVLLYSMSAVDQEKWQAFVKAFTNPGEDTAQVVLVPSDELGDHTVPAEDQTDTGNPDPNEDVIENLDDLFEMLQEYAEQEGIQDSVEMMQGEGAIYVRYQNSLFFQPDSAELLPTAAENLKVLGDGLKQLEDQLWLVSISGHTASVAVDNYHVSDWALSAERAAAVADHFELDSGLTPKVLRPIGFGKNYPIADNDTEEGRARNRRVEMVIISKDSPIVQSSGISSAVFGLFDSYSELEAERMNTIDDLLDPSEVLAGLTGDDAPDAAPEDGQPEDGAAPEDGQPEDGAAPEGGQPEDGAAPEGGQPADTASSGAAPPAPSAAGADEPDEE